MSNATLNADRDDLRVAYLTALAIAVHVAEAALPSPLPGIKPGLANIVTVATLCCFGWTAAAWVGLLRVLAGSLLVGSFLSPTFFLSLAGATAAVAALWLSSKLPGVSALGHSVVAALSHMAAQFLVAWWLFVPHPALPRLLPILMTAALVCGAINGIIAGMMLRRLHTTMPHDGVRRLA